MRVVIDTNVFISGVFWRGAPHRILTLWAKNKIEILVTRKILDEYLRILRKISRNEEIIRKWSLFIYLNSISFEDKDIIRSCRDLDDNKFLNCALWGKADYLVSGDDDLLSLKTVETTLIVTSVRFLKEYGK